MNYEEAIETLQDNMCAICAYGSTMDKCDIRYCDNKQAIETLKQEPKLKPLFCEECGITETRPMYMQRYCRYCGAKMVEPQESEGTE